MFTIYRNNSYCSILK